MTTPPLAPVPSTPVGSPARVSSAPSAPAPGAQALRAPTPGTPAPGDGAPAPHPTTPAGRSPRLPLGPLAAAATLAMFALAAVAPGLLAPGSPESLDLGATLQAPSAAHWFGTDELGRDLYTRVVHGTGLSLLIGLGAAAVSLTLAVLLAAASALTGRILSGAADRTIEILFAFPTLLLALLLIATLGPSPLSLVLAVGVGTAPGYARIVRGQLLSARSSGYVEAATGLGHRRLRVVAAHILPNALRPLVGIFTMSIGQSIVWASSLAFLGLGVAPPSPEWGALLDAGRAYLTAAGWLVVVPGLVIAVLALAATTLGKHIQTRLETGR
ncbi:ABC transporter permease subunit [Brevibacterium pityocampae]|uniref:ABC transporter permease subunit n=1 Tax=Brevibacterium pityocampae TaxID=506594 RepID=UPI0031EFB74D